MRVTLGHRLRLVSHPEIVEVFQTTSSTKPGLPETLERVEPHAFLVQIELL